MHKKEECLIEGRDLRRRLSKEYQVQYGLPWRKLKVWLKRKLEEQQDFSQAAEANWLVIIFNFPKLIHLKSLILDLHVPVKRAC